MSDIVRSLRQLADDTTADEIERLRNALREVRDLSKMRSVHPMSSEADYFRIALAALKDGE